MVNETWLHQRTHAYGIFEAGGCSDHLRGRFWKLKQFLSAILSISRM